MHPGKFEYLRAEGIDHALGLLENHPEAELLAGGHSLLPEITRERVDPDVIVDISDIDAICGVESDGDVAEIGAATTYAGVKESSVLQDGATALVEAASVIGDEQVRNRGTIGGNLVHPVRVSDLSAAIIAIDATIVVEGPDGRRQIAADECFTPAQAIDLAADELLTTVEVPLTTGHTGSAYAKKQSSSARYSLLGVAARLHFDQGRVTDARVGANGVAEPGVKLCAVEDALQGERLDSSTIEAAASAAVVGLDDVELIDDEQASAEYRRHLLPAYTEQALECAAERAGVDVSP